MNATEQCPKCRGAGHLPGNHFDGQLTDGIDCWRCRGAGFVYIQPATPPKHCMHHGIALDVGGGCEVCKVARVAA